jgi:hypothetical protein
MLFNSHFMALFTDMIAFANIDENISVSVESKKESIVVFAVN